MHDGKSGFQVRVQSRGCPLALWSRTPAPIYSQQSTQGPQRHDQRRSLYEPGVTKYHNTHLSPDEPNLRRPVDFSRPNSSAERTELDRVYMAGPSVVLSTQFPFPFPFLSLGGRLFPPPFPPILPQKWHCIIILGPGCDPSSMLWMDAPTTNSTWVRFRFHRPKYAVTA